MLNLGYLSLQFSLVVLVCLLCERGWHRVAVFRRLHHTVHSPDNVLTPIEEVHARWQQHGLVNLVVGRCLELSVVNEDPQCAVVDVVGDNCTDVNNTRSCSTTDTTARTVLWRQYSTWYPPTSSVLILSSSPSIDNHQEVIDLLQRKHPQLWIATTPPSSSSSSSSSSLIVGDKHDQLQNFLLKITHLTPQHFQQGIHQSVKLPPDLVAHSELSRQIVDVELHFHRIVTLMLPRRTTPTSPEEWLQEAGKMLSFLYNPQLWQDVDASLLQWAAWKQRLAAQLAAEDGDMVATEEMLFATKDDLLFALNTFVEFSSPQIERQLLLRHFHDMQLPQTQQLLSAVQALWFHGVSQNWQQYFVMFGPFCLPMLVPVSRALYKVLKSI